MKKKSILLVILLISLLIVSLPVISDALLVDPSDYTGYRTADSSDTAHYGIYTNGWEGVEDDGSVSYFEISWAIDFNMSYPKPFKYEYTFDIPEPKGLSHFIIEVSENTTSDNFDPYFDPDEDLKLHTENQGNPGLPADLFGIKTETSGVAGLQTYIIYSDRKPMWGDFFAKDGAIPGTNITVIAYNLGFNIEPTLGDKPFNKWIAVPDTETVIPEPATCLLLLFGLIGIVGVKKRLS